MYKGLKKRDLNTRYRSFVIERFLKLRYNIKVKLNYNIRFRFGCFYNQKYLKIVRKIKNSFILRMKLQFVVFCSVFRYKFVIKGTMVALFYKWISGQYQLMNCIIIKKKDAIWFGTQDISVYNLIVENCESVEELSFTKNFLIVESNKVLMRIQPYGIKYYTFFEKIILHPSFSLITDIQFQIMIVQVLIYSVLCLVYCIVWYYFMVYIKNIYGYCKTIK